MFEIAVLFPNARFQKIAALGIVIVFQRSLDIVVILFGRRYVTQHNKIFAIIIKIGNDVFQIKIIQRAASIANRDANVARLRGKIEKRVFLPHGFSLVG